MTEIIEKYEKGKKGKHARLGEARNMESNEELQESLKILTS